MSIGVMQPGMWRQDTRGTRPRQRHLRLKFSHSARGLTEDDFLARPRHISPPAAPCAPLLATPSRQFSPAINCSTHCIAGPRYAENRLRLLDQTAATALVSRVDGARWIFTARRRAVRD